MKRAGFYKRDWFLAVLIGLLFFIAISSGAGILGKLELIAYDMGVRGTNRVPGATDQVAIIAIDEQSINEIGRWPWPRSVHAKMIEKLTQADVHGIGMFVYLTEPQVDPGLAAIRKARNKLEAISSPKPKADFDELRAILTDAEANLDTDLLLGKSIADSHRVYLPMITALGERLGNPDKKPPEYVGKSRFSKMLSPPTGGLGAPQVAEAVFPLETFGNNAAAIGHMNFGIDPDNGIRSIYLAEEYDGEYYPALPLLLAAGSLNIDPKDIEIEFGKGIRIGKLFIGTDDLMRMSTGFYSPRDGESSAFPIYSFRDVQNDKLSPSALKNKTVLIGPTAAGIGSKFATPISKSDLMSETELMANVIASILNQDFYKRPGWTTVVELLILVLIGAYLAIAFPRLGARNAAIVSVLLLIVLLGAEQYLMVSGKIWIQNVSPALFLVVGHIALTTKRYFSTEKEKVAAETDSAYSNRMLGLAFQAQGQLDMALDKFRKLPVDDSVLELLYNLALDFERKRQFHKAINCYDQILQHDPKFRDVADRKKRSTQAEGTIVLGGRGATGGGTIIMDGAAEKPTLGRYQIEKELGRGAMGTVYLGRDPKINRLVAIKTMALTQEFEANELAEVRERFFREAETAGRLHHPNIVTIFDAGEEHDLAYIAMEFLQGKDLSHNIKPDAPLDFDFILDISAKIADGLAYAHKNDVVHRDIKPANIIYHDADKSIKITDFGIARITATSKTKTGVVLGTPSYMSPEQLAGKHVDGRSDLFSFGSMLYEFVTGKTPFTGDSLATLMFQIANGPTPDVRQKRPDTPDALVAIIERLLQKDPDKRYATGDELKKELEQCRAPKA
jgi:serine/threonine-protein kinase